MSVNLKVFPNPDPTTYSLSSSYYSVSVLNDSSEYENSHVYSGTKVSWVSTTAKRNLWASGSSPVLSYTTFEIEDSSVVKVENIGQSITSIDIGPYSKDKNSNTLLSEGVAYIPVNKNDKLWVTINNNASSPLFIFADEPFPTFSEVSSSYPLGSGWTHIHFTSGINFMSSLGGTLDTTEGYPNRRKLTSKTLVYSDPGSYVKGHFNISGCNDIKIMGKGVFSLEFYDWWNDFIGASYSEKSHGTFLYNSNPSTTNSYLDWRVSGNGISGVTVINTPFYFNSEGSLQIVDNVKYISPWNYNTDGFRVFNYYNRVEGAKIINTFAFNADDTIFPAVSQAQGNCLVSSCYLASHHGSVVVNYFTNFSNGLVDGIPYQFSGIDLDIRSYVPYEGGKGAVMRILSDQTVTSLPANVLGPVNLNFSGVRIENDIEGPILMLGNITYPYGSVPPYGNMLGIVTNLQFIDFTASSTFVSSWGVSSNVISGLNFLYKPTNILFKNFIINGVKLTENNKDNYFDFLGSTNPSTDNITFISDFPSTLKVSPIKLLN